jgi:hypothetical protein
MAFDAAIYPTICRPLSIDGRRRALCGRRSSGRSHDRNVTHSVDICMCDESVYKIARMTPALQEYPVAWIFARALLYRVVLRLPKLIRGVAYHEQVAFLL